MGDYPTKNSTLVVEFVEILVFLNQYITRQNKTTKFCLIGNSGRNKIKNFTHINNYSVKVVNQLLKDTFNERKTSSHLSHNCVYKAMFYLIKIKFAELVFQKCFSRHINNVTVALMSSEVILRIGPFLHW